MIVGIRPSSWRLRLVRDVGLSFIVKLGVLTLLWALFFSSAHRCRVDGSATANRLAVSTSGGDPGSRSSNLGEDHCDRF